MDPFEIFPEEIWEMILEKVEDPQDARNVLKASKKLEERFQCKKHLWLLDQVLDIPRFIDFVYDRSSIPHYLLKIRSVCKVWRYSVDTHLQKGRSLSPWHYDEPCPKTLKEWTSPQDVGYFQDEDLVCWVETGDTRLMSAGDIQKFLDENESLPPEVNPFPAKSVCLVISDFEREEEDLDEMEWELINEIARVEFTRWLECVRQLFEKFGRHIHNLKLKIVLFFRICPCTSMEFYNGFMEVIRLLSNLKDIVYVARDLHYHPAVEDRYLVAPGLEFPLESLTLTGFKDPISTVLLSRFGHLLRKLVVRQIALQKIQQQANCFLQLRELVIIDVYGIDDAIKDLRNCAFPKLVKLKMHWEYYGNRVERMLPLLKIFPTLKYLDLEVSDPDGIEEGRQSSWFKEEQDLSLRRKLEFIAIPFSPMLSYKFLLNFPDLKEIKFVGEKWMWEYPYDINKSDVFPDLHEKIANEKLHESNIWNVFPKLQVVRVEWGKDFEDGNIKAVLEVDFHRFDYNHQQQLLLGGESQAEEVEELFEAEGEFEEETDDFLKQYEALKCAGCDEVIGYRDRASGKIYCSGGHPFGCFVNFVLDAE